MAAVAGVKFPCVNCRLLHRFCRQRNEIMKQVFFAIGSGRQVACSDHEEHRYHGLEGVKA